MNLTVGKLEEELRKYSKGTDIHVGCNCCNHGSSGGEDIIKIEDKTGQTYGYIDISINATHESKVELAANEKEFYEKEISKLKEELELEKKKVRVYKETIQSINTDINFIDSKLKWV